MLGWIVLGLIIAGMIYFRVAPIDVSRWHKPISAQANEDRPGGAVRIIAGGPGVLAQLSKEMQALPRTKLIAGSIDEQRLTYVTRSLVFGFPDFTTIEQVGDEVKLFARLRFGKSDLGVNRRRLEQLIARPPQG